MYFMSKSTTVDVPIILDECMHASVDVAPYDVSGYMATKTVQLVTVLNAERQTGASNDDQNAAACTYESLARQQRNGHCMLLRPCERHAYI